MYLYKDKEVEFRGIYYQNKPFSTMVKSIGKCVPGSGNPETLDKGNLDIGDCQGEFGIIRAGEPEYTAFQHVKQTETHTRKCELVKNAKQLRGDGINKEYECHSLNNDVIKLFRCDTEVMELVSDQVFTVQMSVKKDVLQLGQNALELFQINAY